MTITEAGYLGQSLGYEPTLVDELDIVCALAEAATVGGMDADALIVRNFYLALKSHPLVIVAGPAQTGKTALVERLAQLLTGDNFWQYQRMTGHPYWAGGSPTVCAAVELQTRFIENKLFRVIADAWQPDNTGHLYLACLTQISPAELYRFFTPAGLRDLYRQFLQLDRGQIRGLPPTPPNLRLIGLMDTSHFRWWNELPAQAIVIQWSGIGVTKVASPHIPMMPGGERTFLHSCVRTEQAAYAQLTRLFPGRQGLFRPLVEFLDLLDRCALHLTRVAVRRLVIFLANAWTAGGTGLLASSREMNLQLALDLGFKQIVLPSLIVELASSRPLRRKVTKFLAPEFPHAAAFLEGME